MNRKPKDVFGYSSGLWNIVERVAVGGQTFKANVDTLQKARKMRGKFYAFRQGLERALSDAMQPGSAHADKIGQLQDTLQWARVTVCWFDEKAAPPIPVFYMSKEQTPDALFYQQALASATPDEVPPDQEKELAEMAARIAEATSAIPPPKKNPYY